MAGHKQSLATVRGLKTTLDFDLEKEPSLTVQSDAPMCDINNIMKRFEQTGVLEHTAVLQAQYGDVSEISDYQSAMNYVTGARTEFMKLPANVRAKFNNDVGQLLDFITNPENKAEAVKLGLLEAEAAPAEQAAPSGAAAPTGAQGAGASAPAAAGTSGGL